MESQEHIEQFFAYSHLPPHLQEVSKPFADLAAVVLTLPRNPERTVALRKLLEAKDGGQTVLAKVADLIRRYILTGLVDGVWDELSAMLGVPVGASVTAAAGTVGDLNAELEKCCTA